MHGHLPDKQCVLLFRRNVAGDESDQITVHLGRHAGVGEMGALQQVAVGGVFIQGFALADQLVQTGAVLTLRLAQRDLRCAVLVLLGVRFLCKHNVYFLLASEMVGVDVVRARRSVRSTVGWARSMAPRSSTGEASMSPAFIIAATRCRELKISDCSQSLSSEKRAMNSSCNGVGAFSSRMPPASVRRAYTRRLSVEPRVRWISSRFSSRSRMVVMVAWLRDTSSAISPMVISPRLAMDCITSSCGAVSPATLLRWREYISVARMILRNAINTSSCLAMSADTLDSK